MAASERPHQLLCGGCSEPTAEGELCAVCREAFGVVSALHPAAVFRSRRPDGPVVDDLRLGDDIDLWDAWSLLGDVGDRRGRGGLDS